MPISEIVSVIGLHISQTLGASVFSPPVPAGGASGILVQAITANVRFTLSNGQPPTASIGFQIIASDAPMMIPLGNGFTPQFIQESAGAILQYQWIG